MARPPKITRDQVIRRFETFCPNETNRPTVVKFMMDIYDRFKQDGLADRAFDSQLVGIDDDQFQQRISELLLAHWLWEDGFTLSSANQGPDFKASKGDEFVWIELVTPLPTSDVLRDYARPLEYGETRVSRVPSEELKLKWLSALDAKRQQMEQHVQAGIVGPDDPYVIAVNKRMLDRFNFDVDGISQCPLPVELGFGFGPKIIQIDKTTLKSVSSGYQHVGSITKSTTGSAVEASLFLLPDYQRVSGIFGIALHNRRPFGDQFPSAFAYNPFAKVQVPRRLIGATQYWTGEFANNVWVVFPLHPVVHGYVRGEGFRTILWLGVEPSKLPRCPLV